MSLYLCLIEGYELNACTLENCINLSCRSITSRNFHHIHICFTRHNVYCCVYTKTCNVNTYNKLLLWSMFVGNHKTGVLLVTCGEAQWIAVPTNKKELEPGALNRIVEILNKLLVKKCPFLFGWRKRAVQVHKNWYSIITYCLYCESLHWVCVSLKDMNYMLVHLRTVPFGR